MCCVFALMALIGPRVAFLFAWIFDSNRVDLAIPSIWVKLLGLVFLPWTALFWVIAYAPILGVSGFGYLLVGFGFMLDLSSYASGRYSRSSA